MRNRVLESVFGKNEVPEEIKVNENIQWMNPEALIKTISILVVTVAICIVVIVAQTISIVGGM